jgi:hypothetical protein
MLRVLCALLPLSAIEDGLKYVYINVNDSFDADQRTDDVRLTISIEPGSLLFTHLIKKFPPFIEAHGPLLYSKEFPESIHFTN